jgi:hypothetical protein
MELVFVDEHGDRDLLVNFVFFRGFCAKSLRQLSLYPVSLYLYLHVFLIQ